MRIIPYWHQGAKNSPAAPVESPELALCQRFYINQGLLGDQLTAIKNLLQAETWPKENLSLRVDTEKKARQTPPPSLPRTRVSLTRTSYIRGYVVTSMQNLVIQGTTWGCHHSKFGPSRHHPPPPHKPKEGYLLL